MSVIDLTNRTAIVTGEAVASARPSRRNCSTPAPRSKSATPRAFVGAFGTVSAHSIDVADAVDRGADDALSRLGTVDFLVNCAGVTPGIVPTVDVSRTAWRENIAVNLDGVFCCCERFVPAWRRVAGAAS